MQKGCSKVLTKDFLKSEQGIALLQVAIVTPVILIFLAAVVDFGVALNQHLMFTRAVHEGVMLAARRPLLTTDANANGFLDDLDLFGIDTNGDGLPDTPGTVNLVEERIKNAIRSYSLNTKAASIIGIDVNDTNVFAINSVIYNRSTTALPTPPDDTVTITATLVYRGFFIRDLQMSSSATAPYIRIS